MTIKRNLDDYASSVAINLMRSLYESVCHLSERLFEYRLGRALQQGVTKSEINLEADD